MNNFARVIGLLQLALPGHKATQNLGKSPPLARLTYSISVNKSSAVSKIADKNLPILSTFMQHIPLKIIPVSFANSASSKRGCKLLSYKAFTNPVLVS